MAGTGSYRTRAGLVVAAAALVVGAGGGFALGRTGGADAAEDDHGHEPGSIEAIAEELAEDQAADRAALSAQLAEAARTAHDSLGEVLRAMAPTVSADAAAPAAAATPDDAAAWAADAGEAAQTLQAVPEGTSEFNVTRQALLASALMLADTATDLSRALDAGSRPAVTEVAEQRDAAVRLWQAGAEQLDGLVVEAGQEHIHLFLDPSGDPDAVPREFREPEEP